MNLQLINPYFQIEILESEMVKLSEEEKDVAEQTEVLDESDMGNTGNGQNNE